jgi:NAD(P)-dependent dehydrogenase (short-subunit alcohol dehydrogenase family)
LASGWKVLATARSEHSMQDLRTLGAQVVKLDVASTESISGLAWQIDGLEFDLAIYVAGIFGPHGHSNHAPTTRDFDDTLHTNVLGAMQVIPTVAPMVEAAKGKFIFISSGMGSIADAANSGGWVYRVSKAALNMAVKTASLDYPNAALVCMCPGWVKTDLGGADAALSAEESVAGMLRVIESLTLQDSGSFRNHAGAHLPW